MGTDQIYLHFRKAFSQRLTVVSAVSYQALDFTSLWDKNILHRFFCERGLMWGCRTNELSQRKTLAVCHHHELCAFAALRLPDCEAPFFAGAKVASTNDSLQSSCFFSSSWDMKQRQALSQVPSCSQRLSLRQQVDGLGYESGKAFHGAPVHSTQRMPSKHGRFGINLRPPFFDCWGSGRWGAIFSQCASLNNLGFRAIGVHLRP